MLKIILMKDRFKNVMKVGFPFHLVYIKGEIA